MKKLFKLLILPLIIGAILLLSAGCSPKVVSLSAEPKPTEAITHKLRPYLSPTIESVATTVPAPTNLPELLPSPTPFTHTIVQGDTLLGIALQYGVELDDLRAVNPEIDPNILSVGKTVIIPLGEDGAIVMPTENPLPINLHEPVCYLTLLKGMWCFISVENTLDVPIESLSLQINLLAENGEIIAFTSAVPPINLIPTGKTIPAVAYFPGPVNENLQPTVQIKSAFPANNLQERYILLVMEDSEISVETDGLSATISGLLRLPQESLSAREVRVVAVAYSQNNAVLGVRIWEAESGLSTGDALTYQFTVYSLENTISRVEVFSEARP